MKEQTVPIYQEMYVGTQRNHVYFQQHLMAQ